MAETESVVEALSAVMSEVGAVAKTRSTKGGGGPQYDYRGIDDIVMAVSPAFRKHGLVMRPIGVDLTHKAGKTKEGNPNREVTAVVTYRVQKGADDYIDVTAAGEGLDTSDKATNKAMAFAWRTALTQMLTLPTGDPDPDADHQEHGEEEPAPSTSELKRMLYALRRQGRDISDDRIAQILADNQSTSQRRALAKWIADQEETS